MGDPQQNGAAESLQAEAARPSGVRHGILGLITLMAVLLYLDRICISVAAPALRGPTFKRPPLST